MRLANLDRGAILALKVKLDHRVFKARLAHKDPKANLEPKDLLEEPDPLDLAEHQARQGHRVILDPLVPREILVEQELQDLQELTEVQARKALVVALEIQAVRAAKVQLVSPDRREPLVQQVAKDLLDQLALLELLVRLVFQDQVDREDS